MELYGKLSRLYRPEDLKPGAGITLGEAQLHYLKNVLRKNINDTVRIFNGRDGEYTATIDQLDKKGGRVVLKEKIRTQPDNPPPLHLLFAPIKKDRLDFLIEKSVELGVTDLHPVITARTENRNLNASRIAAQIIEAAEQCERMTIPVLHPALPFREKLAGWGAQPLYWCHERSDAPLISNVTEAITAFLVGPEGGFDNPEASLLEAHESVKPISLGETVYRAETASFLCLTAILLKNQK